MHTESKTEMATPASYDDTPLPRRQVPKGMLPGSWMNRSLKIDYLSADGAGTPTRGTLLDWLSTEPYLSVDGVRTIIAWDAIRSIESRRT